MKDAIISKMNYCGIIFNFIVIQRPTIIRVEYPHGEKTYKSLSNYVLVLFRSTWGSIFMSCNFALFLMLLIFCLIFFSMIWEIILKILLSQLDKCIWKLSNWKGTASMGKIGIADQLELAFSVEVGLCTFFILGARHKVQIPIIGHCLKVILQVAPLSFCAICYFNLGFGS